MSRKIIISIVACLLCLLPNLSMAQTLEYWFDDQFDQLSTTTIATSEAEQELSLDLRNNTKFPYGFHKLHMRIIIGGKPSAVYSTGVLKLAAGKATKLEFWIDGDRENITTIDGKLANNGKDYIFINELNLGDISPGYHRLYCRPVSNSKITTGAITSVPIIVKSLYSNIDPAEVTVTEQAYWIDNEEPEIVTVAHPRNVITQPYKFDTRNLSEGQHTLYMQFGNSAGIWNGPVSTTFTKTKYEPPVITALILCLSGKNTILFVNTPVAP